MNNKKLCGHAFSIETKSGECLLYCVHSDNIEGEIVKVYYDPLDRDSSIERQISDGDGYYVGFPLRYAIGRKIVKNVGNYPHLTESLKKPTKFRTEHKVRGVFYGWHIYDSCSERFYFVEDLNDEQLKLSPHGVANDTFIKERFESGWRLEDWR